MNDNMSYLKDVLRWLNFNFDLNQNNYLNL